MSVAHGDSRILIVDDHQPNLALLEGLLRRAGYRAIEGVTDGQDAIDLVNSDDRIDLMLLDLHMPQVDGYDVLDGIATRRRADFLPVLVLTADLSEDTKRRALRSGANDFLSKPLDIAETLLRVGNLIATRDAHVTLRATHDQLDDLAKRRTRQLETAQLEMVSRLAAAAELRDDDTGDHMRRVGTLASGIARGLGLDPVECEVIRLAAPLHDIGKIAIPDSVLLKPGRLSEAEFEVMKEHTKIGADLLRDASSVVLETAERIARSHHERWDGAGYPLGLSGADIPLAGRIVAVADVYDALTNDRPYKSAWSRADAIAEIRYGASSQFDPRVVAAFERLDLSIQH